MTRRVVAPASCRSSSGALTKRAAARLPAKDKATARDRLQWGAEGSQGGLYIHTLRGSTPRRSTV